MYTHQPFDHLSSHHYHHNSQPQPPTPKPALPHHQQQHAQYLQHVAHHQQACAQPQSPLVLSALRAAGVLPPTHSQPQQQQIQQQQQQPIGEYQRPIGEYQWPRMAQQHHHRSQQHLQHLYPNQQTASNTSQSPPPSQPSQSPPSQPPPPFPAAALRMHSQQHPAITSSTPFPPGQQAPPLSSLQHLLANSPLSHAQPPPPQLLKSSSPSLPGSAGLLSPPAVHPSGGWSPQLLNSFAAHPANLPHATPLLGQTPGMPRATTYHAGWQQLY